MNALNLLSARLIGPSTSNAPPQMPPAPPGELVKTRYWFWIQRTRKRPAHLRSEKDGGARAGADAPEGPDEKRSADTELDWRADEGEAATGGGAGRAVSQRGGIGPGPECGPEDMPRDRGPRALAGTRWTSWPVTAAQAVFASIRWIFSTLAAPSFILIRYISDDRAKYSPLLPVRGAYRFVVRLWRRRATAQTNGILAAAGRDNPKGIGEAPPDSQAHAMQMESPHGPRAVHPSTAAAPLSGIDEQELETARAEGSGELTRPPLFRTISSSSSDESSSTGQRVRIKTSKEDAQKRRRSRKTDSTGSRLSPHSGERAGGREAASSLTPASLKSPTSPASSLGMSRYPRAPAPPRPLIPRRRSSNVHVNFPPSEANLKTLILDLDETLIHSLAKGGRMTTGHMVEVKLNPSVGTGSGLSSAPQHPILYYVHKRPHCDEFLRKVCKWYKLVVFTAAVQEYADPVIDWLEQDRKYFARRFYRQHCTLRGGNYIKDISSVEPDLSRVMIIDNSPASYVFHPEGWINDPTDNHLLNLIPLLEAMQHVTDVRALLALRMGEISAAGSPL